MGRANHLRRAFGDAIIVMSDDRESLGCCLSVMECGELSGGQRIGYGFLPPAAALAFP